MRLISPDPREHPDDLLEVLRRMRPALLAFFLRRLHDRALAEDLVQDMFVRISGMDKRVAGNPEGYIFQSAANLLRDHVRREAIRVRYIQSWAEDGTSDVDAFDAERLLAARQSVGCVAATLGTLPDRTRQIFVLYRLENMPRKAIASAFGISVSAVEKHIAKAMQALLTNVGDRR